MKFFLAKTVTIGNDQSLSTSFFPNFEHMCEKQDSINVDVNMGRAMIERVKTFSLSTITALSKDDIIAKVLLVYYAIDYCACDLHVWQ